MDLRDRIWNNMANVKFKAIFTRKCSKLAEKRGNGLSIFLAISSGSSVAAWAVWQEYPSVWGGVIGFSQVLQIVKPYEPVAQTS